MSFEWWHPECTATHFIIVTIVEILVVCMSNTDIYTSFCIRTILKKFFGLH